MARRNPMNDALNRLSAIRGDPRTPAARRVLLDVFAKARGLPVAKAALIVAEVACGPDRDEFDWTRREEVLDDEWARDFMPALTEAFTRLCDGPEHDLGAHGKIAVARALNRMECGDDELFVRGVGYSQPEPEMGRSVDRAPPLRAESMLALVRLRFRRRLRLMTDMLWDGYQAARVGAVRAALYDGSEGAEAILRAKGIAGDAGDDFRMGPPDGGPIVMGEVFGALLALDRRENVPFVAEAVLDEKRYPPVREQAALSLGECRSPEALAALVDLWRLAEGLPEPRRGDGREFILCGMAVNGGDEAIDAIAGWMRDAGEMTARSYRRLLASIWGEDNPRLRRIMKNTSQ